MIDKTAVILAGGKSSRMNYNDKSFLDFKGISFIEKIIMELSDYKEIIIVSNKDNLYDYLGVKVVKDMILNKGPLAGIYSALMNASYDECLCIACDMPMITKKLVNFLGEIKGEYDALVPNIDGKIEPLCSIYKKTCLDKIKYCLDNDIRKIISFYSYINVKYIQKEVFHSMDIEYEFKNINTPDDYSELIKNV